MGVLKFITRTVWILSVVSLLTDTASEMLYPILPIYLKTIGFTIFLIGILEGVAEATAGLSKGYFGKLSDTTHKRVPFVQIGYAFSAISKPMMAVFIYPLWILFARTIDRFGKGIRTGARDAILSDESKPETKGKIFGFHRSMDTLGAVMGPLFALLYLYYKPEDYKTLFYIAFVPGLFAVLATIFLKEENKHSDNFKTTTPFFSFLGYWKASPTVYKKLVIGLLVFTLFNSSDVFLILKAKETGLNDTTVIGVYIFYNLIYALFAFPLGILADKIGLKTIFITGPVVFAGCIVGMSFNTNRYVFFRIVFSLRYLCCGDRRNFKSMDIKYREPKDTATAIGTFTGSQSICTMLASSLTGLFGFSSVQWLLLH